MGEQPFYVGQKVVCIKDHSQGVIKKGQQFTVTGVHHPNCKCDNWIITIGIPANTNFFGCSRCFTIVPAMGNEYEFGYRMFAPAHEGFKAVSFTKILEEELVSSN